MLEKKRVIAVDFDGTLADDSRVTYPDLGPPIPTMVERVRKWIQEGHTVKIFTARLAEKDRDKERDQVKRLTEWFEILGLTNKDGSALVLTAMKLPDFDEFWDDRAVGVIRNTGATYFEAEHYRDNYDPKSGMFGASKEESSRPREDWRTPQDSTRNESQLEFQFGGTEYEQFVQAQTESIAQGLSKRLRSDPEFKSLQTYIATDPREPYTR